METLKNWLEWKSKTQILFEVIRWPAIILTSIRLFFPAYFQAIYNSHWSAAAQALCVSLLFYYNWDIVQSIRSIKFKFPSVRVSPGNLTGTISNKKKDVEKIADFIIKAWGLPVAKAREILGRTWEKCKQIGDRLEEWQLMRQDKADCNKRKLREWVDFYTLAFALSYCLDTTTTPEQLPQVIEYDNTLQTA